EADPDYFGRDTGDASADDPLNADEIGENEILVVSFGTSFNDSRAQDIGGIEKAIQAANPDASVRRAFTAQIIINHVLARDGEKIDNVEQALERAVNNGVKNLLIQPTHLMHGAEYDELIEAVEAYADKFETVAIAEPLLGEVGADASVINEDKKAVAKTVVAEAVKEAGFDSLDAADSDGTAFVFMGHGTAHTAKVSYSQMATQMNELGYKNVFIGTVEGEPEETACENVIDAVAEAGYKHVILRPLMVVAGDHANNDMAGDDEDTWKSMFTASGKFDTVDCQIAGLGRIEDIQKLYVDHTAAALQFDGEKKNSDAADLADGTYQVTFKTDSSMFHINEALDDMAELTVKDGEMTVHITLASKNILNLYPGLAEDAAKDGAVLLEPTTDPVKYEDGTEEEVYGFDVPVPCLDEEFDLALIGKKGTWYDHKVTVSKPVAE
ncbi:MAG: sirohydrochlorin cobaltochelatase, partial [Lachnospiraceae bacterium]|nr:sirohydrochlorin cobaltochelatase [Lachnospiraceae bacterium]